MKCRATDLAEKLRKESKSLFVNRKVLLLAADALEQIKDERDSAWDMLDEIKQSDLDNFKVMLESMQAERLTSDILKKYKNNRGKDGTN